MPSKYIGACSGIGLQMHKDNEKQLKNNFMLR